VKKLIVIVLLVILAAPCWAALSLSPLTLPAATSFKIVPGAIDWSQKYSQVITVSGGSGQYYCSFTEPYYLPVAVATYQPSSANDGAGTGCILSGMAMAGPGKYHFKIRVRDRVSNEILEQWMFLTVQ
jgi:hypothetical protein